VGWTRILHRRPGSMKTANEALLLPNSNYGVIGAALPPAKALRSVSFAVAEEHGKGSKQDSTIENLEK
jgi:hypothetical protein